jgi:hypothetical protein
VQIINEILQLALRNQNSAREVWVHLVGVILVPVKTLVILSAVFENRGAELEFHESLLEKRILLLVLLYLNNWVEDTNRVLSLDEFRPFLLTSPPSKRLRVNPPSLCQLKSVKKLCLIH